MVKIVMGACVYQVCESVGAHASREYDEYVAKPGWRKRKRISYSFESKIHR
jgi:hypothetical protein